MTELEQYIHTYFSITEEDTSKITSLFKPVSLKKGDFYLNTGKPCDRLSFIQSGFLRVYACKADEEVTQWIGSKGSFMGDLASLTFKTPSRWNIQVLTDTELYIIHKEE